MNPAARRRAISVIIWILGFFLAIWLLGFNIAVPIVTFLYLKAGSGEKWSMALALAVLMWLFFYGLFGYAIHLPFPKGILLQWMG